MNIRKYIENLTTIEACDSLDFSLNKFQLSDLPIILYYYETVYSKTVLIKNIPGKQSQVLGNAYSDIHRLCVSLGINPSQKEIDTLGNSAEGSLGGMGGFGNNRAYIFDALQRTSLILLKNKLMKSLDKFCDVNVIDTAPCMENFIPAAKANLTDLIVPIQFCSGDGGAYINSGVIITRSPKTGAVNYAIRRHQIRNGQELGAFINEKSDTMRHIKHAAQRGERLEAAIVLGVSPAVLFAACMSVPENIGETSVAGNLQGRPLDVVACKTINMQVPACSEIVLEGYIDPQELKNEGPMIEYSDFSAGISKRNVFHLTGIMHRTNPIYNAIRSGRSADHELLQTITQWSRARTLKNDLNNIFTNVVNEVVFAAGSVGSHVIIQVKSASKRTGDDILKWILNNYIVKMATIVDENICPFNQEEVAWATFAFAGDSSDFIKIESAPTTPIDPSSVFCQATGRNQVCKIGINAISSKTYHKPSPEGWNKDKEAYIARTIDSNL